jgi:hypothetical protein
VTVRKYPHRHRDRPDQRHPPARPQTRSGAAGPPPRAGRIGHGRASTYWTAAEG